MLETIVNGFNWIMDLLQTIADFIVNIVMGLGNIIKSIPIVINMLTQSIGYLPSTIAAFATITITISVVYLLVGRQTGG